MMRIGENSLCSIKSGLIILLLPLGLLVSYLLLCSSQLLCFREAVNRRWEEGRIYRRGVELPYVTEDARGTSKGSNVMKATNRLKKKQDGSPVEGLRVLRISWSVADAHQ